MSCLNFGPGVASVASVQSCLFRDPSLSSKPFGNFSLNCPRAGSGDSCGGGTYAASCFDAVYSGDDAGLEAVALRYRFVAHPDQMNMDFPIGQIPSGRTYAATFLFITDINAKISLNEFSLNVSTSAGSNCEVMAPIRPGEWSGSIASANCSIGSKGTSVTYTWHQASAVGVTFSLIPTSGRYAEIVGMVLKQVPDTCAPQGSCLNTLGSYSCSCPSGYGGTQVCDDLDECALGTDTCSPYATCTNTVGSYTCTCLPGFTGDGFTCADTNECSVNNGTCGSGACANTFGSYYCRCDAGYRYLAESSPRCQDMNECLTAGVCGAATLSTFSSASALDFSGSFVHALYTMSLGTLPVGSASFTGSVGTGSPLTITGAQAVTPQYNTPSFSGNVGDNLNLSRVLANAFQPSSGGVNFTFALTGLTVGARYKIQFLWTEAAYNSRGFAPF